MCAPPGIGDLPPASWGVSTSNGCLARRLGAHGVAQCGEPRVPWRADVGHPADRVGERAGGRFEAGLAAGAVAVDELRALERVAQARERRGLDERRERVGRVPTRTRAARRA